MIGKLMILWHYLRAKYRFRFMSRERLAAWQRKKVMRHLTFVRSRSPFYRERWGQTPLSEWERLPMIDKTLMMERFDTLNTLGIRKDEAFRIALKAESSRDFSPTIGGVTIGLSSGTSGNRGLFLVSARERFAWVGSVTAKVLPRSLLHRERIAFFLRANSNLYGSVNSGRLRFAFYDLLDPLDAHVDRLNGFKPTLLVAPPSVLRFLADAKREGRLDIDPLKIVSVAETLDPLDKRYIEEAFGQIAHQIYQCTEGFLASTCPHGTLHLNEDIVVIQKEYLDEKLRKFVPVITDFSRSAQPIVRYRLNDILTEAAAPCPCGSPFTAIERIEGRCDDMVYAPSSAKPGQLTPVFPDFLTRAVIAAAPEVKQYRIVQLAPDRIDVFLLADNAEKEQAQRSVARSLESLFRQMACIPPAIRFGKYEHTPGPAKLRRVERRFALEAFHRAV
ncbi:F390 synthetase-related protein [Paenibacillus sp. MBLB4367]|uniref:F390 synthetase-related protein n=1 Tax=Paenibacillus sp. MBLB4367 TaxID=3384767 RepID=UPI0039081C4C